MRSGDFILKAVLLGRGDVGPALKAIELNLEWNRVMHLYARGHRGFFCGGYYDSRRKGK